MIKRLRQHQPSSSVRFGFDLNAVGGKIGGDDPGVDCVGDGNGRARFHGQIDILSRIEGGMRKRLQRRFFICENRRCSNRGDRKKR
jgi:hypothetical protein